MSIVRQPQKIIFFSYLNCFTPAYQQFLILSHGPFLLGELQAEWYVSCPSGAVVVQTTVSYFPEPASSTIEKTVVVLPATIITASAHKILILFFIAFNLNVIIVIIITQF
jgi:hypothetical protein